MDLTELREAERIQYDQRHPWEVCRAKIVNRLITSNSTTPIKTIVDIGSGDAFVANYLIKKNKAQVHAIDTGYNKALIDKLQKINQPGRIKFYQSVVEFSNSTPDHPEIILLLDVLEHINDPSDFLKCIIKDQQFSNAVWIITVPAFNQLYNNHDKKLGHYKRYHRKELIMLLRSCGFAVKESGYFFFSLLPVRYMQKILMRKGQGVEHWKGSGISTPILTLLLKADFWTGYALNRIGIKLPGLSSYAICKQKISQ